MALGIRDDGLTERLEDSWTERRDVSLLEYQKGRQGQLYFIHNPTYHSDISHASTEDSDDDDQDIIFYRNPPPYTVARVKEQPKGFLTFYASLNEFATNIDLEPLSLSTPEIVETSIRKGKDGKYVRFGLFPK